VPSIYWSGACRKRGFSGAYMVSLQSFRISVAPRDLPSIYPLHFLNAPVEIVRLFIIEY